MLTPVRFNGTFQIEKARLDNRQYSVLAGPLPGRHVRALDNDAVLIVRTRSDDGPIADFLRKHGIPHSWRQSR